MGPGLLLLVAGSAWGADASGYWKQTYEARLVDAMYRSSVAGQLIDESLEDMGPDHPERGELLYWQARLRLEEGDTEAAVKLLRDAATFERSERQAVALLALLERQRDAIGHLPYTCTFDKQPCSVKRAWNTVDKGALETRDDGDASVLAWDTTVRGGESDRVLLTLAADVTLRAVSFRIRSSQMESEVRVSVGDGSGGQWSAKVLRVAPDAWLTVDLPLSAFSAANGQAFSRTPPTVRTVEIEDLSGMLTTQRGPNTLLLDDLTLR